MTVGGRDGTEFADVHYFVFGCEILNRLQT